LPTNCGMPRVSAKCRAAPPGPSPSGSMSCRLIRSRCWLPSTRCTRGTVRLWRIFHFHEAAALLYDFFRSNYCDWYVEASKAELAAGGEAAEGVRAVMDQVLGGYLRLLHPFMPHITEELWHRLGYASGPGRRGMILFAAPPAEDSLPGLSGEEKAGATNAVGAVYDAVREARVLRAEFKIPSNQECVVHLARNPAWAGLDLSVFRMLARASELKRSVRRDPAAKCRTA
jgi:Valyl-tRNA synthetase